MKEWNNGWNLKIEKIVHKQGVKSGFYKIMHENSSSYYNKYDKGISIVSIILVTLTATGSVTIATLNDSMIYRIIIAIILYIIGFITAMKEFLNLKYLTEKHRLYSMRFSALSNNIQSQLALDIDDRQNGSDYMGWINSEIDNLLFANPTIPNNIKKNKMFNDISLDRMDDFNEVKQLAAKTDGIATETVIDIPLTNLPSAEVEIKRVLVEKKNNIQRERGIYELNRLSDHLSNS